MPSIGDYRVGINFNPGGLGQVSEIKAAAARFIDLCDELCRLQPATPETDRLWALAMTHAEDAAMWAVKAATKPPQ